MRAWRSLVWDKANQIGAEMEAGDQEMPTTHLPTSGIPQTLEIAPPPV